MEADGLSRNPPLEPEENEEVLNIVNLLELIEIFKDQEVNEKLLKDDTKA